MTRHNFRIGKPYAAKLIRVSSRPIENESALSLRLIRLEFAIYWMTTNAKLLESQGEIACRDLVVGTLIPARRDAGLVAYAEALELPSPINEASQWTGLHNSGRWIELEFGLPESVGQRNPFARIRPFDPTGWTVQEYPYDLTAEWVTIGVVADAVKSSESTVRRRVDALEKEWGSKLVHRTKGNQRRIYLPLFLNLWEE